jgi:hypothetical protein
MVLEIIAESMDKSSEKCSLRYPLSKWAAELQLLLQNVCRQLAVLDAVGLLSISRDGAALEVSAPNLLKYRVEYSQRSKKIGILSRAKNRIQIQRQIQIRTPTRKVALVASLREQSLYRHSTDAGLDCDLPDAQTSVPEL